MNRHLDRKLARDLRKHLGPMVAIALVVACGVATFVAMRSMVHMLGDGQRAYYERARFPQVFVQVRAAPDAILPALRSLPGIARLDARATGEVAVRVPGLREPATARLVGIRSETAGTLNRVVLRHGRLPQEGEPDAVVVSEGFAEANALALGDTLGAVIGGRWRSLRVVGVGISAEFVYELRPGDLFPDPRRYGILWIDAAAAARTFGLEGAWNDLAVTLAPGASERAVIAALDARLTRYGTFGAYGRELHASHKFLSEEIRQNRTFAVVLPALFLAVAAFLVNLVLGRVVAQQRDQIGTLKAFGLPTVALVRHYVLFASVPVAAGSVLGIGVGIRLAIAIAGLYQEFFRFPSLPTPVYPTVLASALAVGAVAAIVGALAALRRILRLPPAEAMRPEPPARYTAGVVERLLGRHGPPVTRMIARGLTHRPWRTALGALGIGLGAAVVVGGAFGFDSVNRIRDVLFTLGRRADLSVVFSEARGRDVLPALAALPGVREVEPVREVAVRVARGHRSRQTALVGVDDRARLRRVVDVNGREIRVAVAGLTLSASLGRVLAAMPGDTVDLELLDGRGRRLALPVATLAEDLSGSAVYVPAERMAELVGAGEAITGADLRVDLEATDVVYDRLTRAPFIRSIVVRDAMRRSFDDTMAKNLGVTLGALVLFASVLAAGTIYNAGRVTLSERARDLASLRVLGFTRGEVGRILFGELGVLAAVGIPVGLLIGAGFAWAVVAAFGTGELFRMPLVIGPRTIAAGVLVPLVAGVLSLWPLRRRIDRIDLIAVLKTRE